MEEEKLESDLKQHLQAVRGISLGKENQDREMQTLQETLKKAGAGKLLRPTVALQVQAVLEKQRSELALSMLGKRERKEPKRQAQALEMKAEACF